MKILVFSDIHGDIAQLEKMIGIFEGSSSEGEGNCGQKFEKFDLMIIPGDFLNHGPRNGLPPHFDQKACAELLNRYRDKIVAVRGNCDSDVDQILLGFPMMCDYTQLFFDGKDCCMRLFVHHGHKAEYASDALAKLLPTSNENCRTLVISGHTHVPVLEEKNGVTFLNPGSITFPKGGSEKSYAVIDTESGKIELKNI